MAAITAFHSVFSFHFNNDYKVNKISQQKLFIIILPHFTAKINNKIIRKKSYKNFSEIFLFYLTIVIEIFRKILYN